jgi:hypothetical protein
MDSFIELLSLSIEGNTTGRSVGRFVPSKCNSVVYAWRLHSSILRYGSLKPYARRKSCPGKLSFKILKSIKSSIFKLNSVSSYALLVIADRWRFTNVE